MFKTTFMALIFIADFMAFGFFDVLALGFTVFLDFMAFGLLFTSTLYMGFLSAPWIVL